VTIEYDGDRPKRVDTVVIIAQHDDIAMQKASPRNRRGDIRPGCPRAG
jgi:S-adenosylmethionine synthetase